MDVGKRGEEKDERRRLESNDIKGKAQDGEEVKIQNKDVGRDLLLLSLQVYTSIIVTWIPSPRNIYKINTEDKEVLHFLERVVATGSPIKFLPGFKGPLPFELEIGYRQFEEGFKIIAEMRNKIYTYDILIDGLCRTDEFITKDSGIISEGVLNVNDELLGQLGVENTEISGPILLDILQGEILLGVYQNGGKRPLKIFSLKHHDPEALGVIVIPPGKTVSNIGLRKDNEIINKKEMREGSASLTDGNGVPFKDIHFMFNSPRKEVHEHNKEVGRDRAPLSNASGEVEEANFSLIDEDGNRRSEDTGYNKGRQFGGDPKEVEGLPDEEPLNPIKDLFQVNLDGHISLLAF
ncbi:hypothetical protein BC332_19428 [Capsicum chinense]|nr:hypothetical protein BC332_19428 [Capsicum chinense]